MQRHGEAGKIEATQIKPSDTVIKSIPVSFGKCTTQTVSNGDQSKAEKRRDFFNCPMKTLDFFR